jgi:CheY-like chemotaxis protein
METSSQPMISPQSGLERILLVEDNHAHAELVRRTLAVVGISNPLDHVSDGRAALDYVFNLGDYVDPQRYPPPALVLLDIRLPKLDGFEVLHAIKTHERLRRIPVIMLTSSGADGDITRAYAGHANSYLVKPVSYDQFTRMMHDLSIYWLTWHQRAH